jgi:hypothetical protein
MPVAIMSATGLLVVRPRSVPTPGLAGLAANFKKWHLPPIPVCKTLSKVSPELIRNKHRALSR